MENRKIEELKETLFGVRDTYDGFVKAVLNYADKSEKRYEIVTEYIEMHPKALSVEILEFISNQEDFYDDGI